MLLVIRNHTGLRCRATFLFIHRLMSRTHHRIDLTALSSQRPFTLILVCRHRVFGIKSLYVDLAAFVLLFDLSQPEMLWRRSRRNILIDHTFLNRVQILINRFIFILRLHKIIHRHRANSPTLLFLLIFYITRRIRIYIRIHYRICRCNPISFELRLQARAIAD